jgi:hypothetical protein
MEPLSTRFEMRNVLDRMESSFALLIAPESRAQNIRLFLGTILGRAIIGIPILFLLPLAIWLMGQFDTITGILLGVIVGI